MKLHEIAAPIYKGRYSFHETTYKAAFQIAKTGQLRGLYVDRPQAAKDLSGDLGHDYGNWVYTTTFSGDHTFYGVGANEVMFVIDLQAVKEQKTFDPRYEGGLLAIRNRVPLSAVECVYIYVEDTEAEQPDHVHAISGQLMQKGVDFDWITLAQRSQVINSYT